MNNRTKYALKNTLHPAGFILGGVTYIFLLIYIAMEIFNNPGLILLGVFIPLIIGGLACIYLTAADDYDRGNR